MRQSLLDYLFRRRTDERSAFALNSQPSHQDIRNCNQLGSLGGLWMIVVVDSYHPQQSSPWLQERLSDNKHERAHERVHVYYEYTRTVERVRLVRRTKPGKTLCFNSETEERSNHSASRSSSSCCVGDGGHCSVRKCGTDAAAAITSRKK